MLNAVLSAADVGPGKPKWTEIVVAVNGTITLIAVLVGATVGYLRFLKSRKLHASCGLSLEATLVSVGSGKALRVTISMKNEGTYQLVFPRGCPQLLQISLASEDMARSALEDTGKIEWGTYIFHQQDILEGDRPSVADDGRLEPGQSYVRCFLIPVPADDAVGYRLQIQVQACPRSVMRLKPSQYWSTETTVVTKEGANG